MDARCGNCCSVVYVDIVYNGERERNERKLNKAHLPPIRNFQFLNFYNEKFLVDYVERYFYIDENGIRMMKVRRLKKWKDSLTEFWLLIFRKFTRS